MTVYIDVLIVMNIYISYFTLRAAGRLLHTDIKFGRLAAASVFGGFSALAALADTGFAGSVLLRATLTAVMALAAFGFGSIKQLAVRSFVCFSVGMLICGAAVLIHELTGSDMIFSANGYVYISVSSLVLVISSAVIYGVLSLLRRIADSPDTDERVILHIVSGGRTADISGITDSGNHLRDFLTGRPVIICKVSAVENVLPANVKAYLAGNTDDIAGIRLIPMNTVSGSAAAAAFLPDSLTAELHGTKKRLDALIAVNRGALEAESFDAVVPSKLLR